MTAPILSILVLAAAFIFFFFFFVVVVESGPNLTKVYCDCGLKQEISNPMRSLALYSLGDAINEAQPGHEPSCKVYVQGYLTVAASAYCFDKVSPVDCIECLNKSGIRLMYKVCPHSFGGQLEVGDCWVKYDTSRFCD